MDYLDIAKQIPSKFRQTILNNNHIFKAVVKWDDWDMMQLWFYYANFIEPDSIIYKYEIRDKRIVADHQCLICLQNLLDRWILLEPYLIALEVESRLLTEL